MTCPVLEKRSIWHQSIPLWIEKLWVHLDYTSHRRFFFKELSPCLLDSLIFCSKVLTSKKESLDIQKGKSVQQQSTRHLDLAIAAAMPGDDGPLQ
jgi:hypothetical protein